MQQAKTFYLREIKAVKLKLKDYENEKNLLNIEEKKYFEKIKVGFRWFCLLFGAYVSESRFC